MPKRKAVLARTHRKITLTLSAQTDEKLTIHARREGKTRSQTANEIIAEELKMLIVSLRGQSGESEPAGQRGEHGFQQITGDEQARDH